MNKVIKYKLYYLISNKFSILFVVLLLMLFNVHAIYSSGVLLSGGRDFNGALKYELILNNYLLVSSIYGLLFSIYLGASTVGPDIQTGNIQVILTSYPYRWKYFVGSYLAVLIFLVSVQLLLMFNIFSIFLIFDVPFIVSEVLSCFVGTILNETVILSITGIASVFMDGLKSAVVGLLGYTFFSIYMYNVIPFVNTYFVFDLTKYRNILCNFVPITNILPQSYTAPYILEAYQMKPVISNIHCYQSIYCVLAISIGAWCFQQREL